MENIYTYWKENLIQFDSTIINELEIDIISRELLIEIGLPEIKNTEALLFKVDKELTPIEYIGEKYYTLGSNIDLDLSIFVVIKSSSSEIYQLHLKEDLKVLMNSSLATFLTFMRIFSEFIDAAKEYSEIEYEENKSHWIEYLLNNFNRIDLKAMEDKNNYWPQILNELYFF